ncbi:hypothetical protein FRD01_22230 [Microvenator marinus]|uniref:Uncharacterized protein n=1 Tax=Microvenator marinus TaxID=2600177 RepID=A0A5B8XVF8_9DELT|nr:hypothetical protein [Microvenator marinus]QED29902.1 hypothetical protein FRD01_22230 [Microvenator marinus]
MKTLFAVILSSLFAMNATAQVADRHTAAKLLPPGDYLCGLGSYKLRDCTIEKAGDGVELIIPDGIGHSIAMRAQLLPSDDKNQLTLLGTLTNPARLCTTCPEGAPDSSECIGTPQDRLACTSQPLVARLKVSNGVARGQLMYYILRPSYDFGATTKYIGYFKLGNMETLTIKPKSKSGR